MVDQEFKVIWERVGKEIDRERAEIDKQISAIDEQRDQVFADLYKAIDEAEYEQAKSLIRQEKELSDRIFELLDQRPSLKEHAMRALIAGLEESIRK